MMFATVIEWLLERIGLVIFLLIFISQIVRGIWRANRDRRPVEAKPDAMEEERRQREIQEEIRRRRAQRHAGPHPVEAPPRRETVPPPVPRPETTQMPEPFGGPLRRVLEEFERERRPVPVPQPPPLSPVSTARHNAELERQQKLADELRSLEETRVLVQRRAAHITADNAAEAASDRGLLTASRAKLLADLRDAGSLRRAFVLREVLGPPVGLR